MRILGIDPGSRKTGYGLIEQSGLKPIYLASGVIRVGDGPMPGRLKAIFEGVSQLIDQYQPDRVSIEQVFLHNNPDSALKLGQARGVALCACALKGLEVNEYSATRIKSTIVGKGHAGKDQVNYMVKHLLKLSGELQEDAADALAAALCHHQFMGTAALAQGRKKSWDIDPARIRGGA
jgi:crossover junction endodeoxyribonuclease RuvC